jgi:DNA-binding SARP family transcriptional activator
MCSTDVDEFMQFCKKCKSADVPNNPAERIALCEKAVELYTGDFFPEEPYEPWIEMKRLALKDEYIDILFHMVEIYKNLGAYEKAGRYCAKILEAEPVLERANQELMRLYALQGFKTDALKVFEFFKRRLLDDIGIDPDPLTVKLADDIRTAK